MTLKLFTASMNIDFKCITKHYLIDEINQIMFCNALEINDLLTSWLRTLPICVQRTFSLEQIKYFVLVFQPLLSLLFIPYKSVPINQTKKSNSFTYLISSTLP